MSLLSEFQEKIAKKEITIGVVGLGYVGLPLAVAFARNGYPVLGLDIDPKKIDTLNKGQSYLKHIPSARFKDLIASKQFRVSIDFEQAATCGALIMCVPTPLTENREPDIRFVRTTTEMLAKTLKKGQLIALESTTYPGTTDELVRPILEQTGLIAGRDFLLVYSPEREDPGNPKFNTTNIPKIVSGYTKDCLEAGKVLYGAVVDEVVPVSSTRVAEMAKLFENIYRAVNIALANELKLLCQRLNLDAWEVIQAASTKPFGFQAFWPGPGLGGHCIPIDPFYLTWKARQVDMSTRFIELAGEINTSMPYHVVQRVQEALNDRKKSLNGSSVLVLGVAYKPDIDDMRESPALKIIDLLQKKGSRIFYHDPYVESLPATRKYTFNLKSSELNKNLLNAMDCVLVVTNHTAIDYDLIAAEADLVVDTRHVVPKERGNVVEA